MYQEDMFYVPLNVKTVNEDNFSAPNIYLEHRF